MPNPPKPRLIHIRNGNPGRRPQNANLNLEPKFSELQRTPKPPIQFAKFKYAKKEWQRVAKELYNQGLLKIVDTEALSGYCWAYENYVQCTKQVKRYGPWLKNNRGEITENPAAKASINWLKLMKSFLTEYGMTPASRTRIAVENINPDENDLDSMIK
jgi:P27 family predicted phage terminase small subunit